MKPKTKIFLLASYLTYVLMYITGYAGLISFFVLLPLWCGIVANEFIAAYRERTGGRNRQLVERVTETLAAKLKSSSYTLGG